MNFFLNLLRVFLCLTDDSGNKRDIEKTDLESDFSVIIANDLNWSAHVDIMVGKA